MTRERSSVLATLGHEAKLTLRECLGDAARLAASVFAAILGLAVLVVAVVEMNLLFLVIGLLLTGAGAVWLWRDSAAIAWLRERHAGRSWRWS